MPCPEYIFKTLANCLYFFFNLILCFLSRARIGHTGCLLLPVPGAIWKIKWFGWIVPCFACHCVWPHHKSGYHYQGKQQAVPQDKWTGVEKFGQMWRSKNISGSMYTFFKEILGSLNKLSSGLSQPYFPAALRIAAGYRNFHFLWNTFCLQTFLTNAVNLHEPKILFNLQNPLFFFFCWHRVQNILFLPHATVLLLLPAWKKRHYLVILTYDHNPPTKLSLAFSSCFQSFNRKGIYFITILH